MTTNEILNSTLNKVNKNNAITISFSNLEKILIKKMMKDYTELILKENNIHISKFLTKLSKDYENGEIDIEDVIYEAENLKTKIDYQNYYKKL